MLEFYAEFGQSPLVGDSWSTQAYNGNLAVGFVERDTCQLCNPSVYFPAEDCRLVRSRRICIYLKER